MKFRWSILSILVAIACVFALAPTRASATPAEEQFFNNVPVSGTLSDGGNFDGEVTITRFDYDSIFGLTVSGTLLGTLTKGDGTVVENYQKEFYLADAALTNPDASADGGFQALATCDILNLDIGAINLNLLGLVLDLSPINLDLTAVSGAGNLLGNLLCGLTGLLDPLGFLNILVGTLDQLLGLLDQINSLI
ncbi:MAG TPA: hypothetical protein VFS21_28585 [Roseiflexaceae bacterium]|nr:hypothetical protein [Roseiflexaceae bacterium]